MNDPLLLHLARIKLAELRTHQASVEAHYQQIEARLAAPGLGEVEQLEVLVEGLSAATFAMKPLHPDATDLRSQLRLLRLEAELGRADLGMVQRWCTRLREEITRGRTRARFSYLFGRLLEQDMVATQPPPDPIPPDKWPLAPRTNSVDPSFIDGLFDRYPELFGPLEKRITHFHEMEALRPATSDEVGALLRAAVQNPLRSEAMRNAARQILGDAAQIHEYASVLTILLHHFPDWRWSSTGCALQMHWAHGKERPTAEAPLLDHLFVNLIGVRWALMLRETLDELNQHHPLTPTPPRPPDFDLLDLPQVTPDLDPRHPETWDRWQTEIRRSLFELRRSKVSRILATECLPATLTEASEGGYRNKPKASGQSQASPTETGNAMSTLLAEVHAHLQLFREVDPDRPQYVLQTDFREFFGSLPHATVLTLAERLGMPPKWISFLAEWLAAPVVVDGQIHRVERGVARDHLLSWGFTALIGWLIDLEIHRESGHPPLRVVDDLFLITDDLQAVRRGHQSLLRSAGALGIEINDDKSGFVRIDAANASAQPPVERSDLPEGPPRWGCLALQPTGRWHIAAERFETLTAWIRSELEDARSVLDLVQRYNRELTYVMYSLGTSLELGPDHRDQVRRAIVTFHQDAFAPGVGIVERLTALAEQLTDAPTTLPVPLVHWPITAGGLGLLNPLILLIATEGNPRPTPEPPPWPPWDGPVTHNQLAQHRLHMDRVHGWWAQRQNQLVQPRPFHAPRQIGSLQQMTQAFIARGSEIGGRTQETLSAYWRWVVATYGPLLLDTVGTFSFLPTELVPLPLILEQRGIVLPPTPASAPATDGPPPNHDDDIPF